VIAGLRQHTIGKVNGRVAICQRKPILIPTTLGMSRNSGLRTSF
jgi:hypothetical protein